MGNYLKAPGGEYKKYNHKLNKLFLKIGQIYGNGKRRDGIRYIMRNVPDSSTSQVKTMLRNYKKFFAKHIDTTYLYKIHKENYIRYSKNILDAISNNDEIKEFVKVDLFSSANVKCLDKLLSDAIGALHLLADLNIEHDSDKAQKILHELKKLDTNL